LQTIKEITSDLSGDKLKSISDDLFSTGKNLFAKNNVKIALIGEDSPLSEASSHVESIWNNLHESKSDSSTVPEIKPDNKVVMEGWSTSTAVSFVAQVFKTVRMRHEDAPALSVISKMLRSMYLHREIREKGGAYGGFAVYNSEDGVFNFGSYRDPHICDTLKVYDRAADFINSGQFTDEDIKEAILQVCSGIDKPDPPGPAARKAFYRKIVSLSDEDRKIFKERLLLLTKTKIIEVAGKYFGSSRDTRSVAVISNERKLKETNEKLTDKSRLRLYRI
jgi:hypothetical protein